MKKIVLSMVVAAAALVGCQKSEDVVADTNQITIKATMRFDAAARTTIKEQDGNYLARWTEEDKNNIKLVGIRSDGDISMIYAKDIHLENDGETATFEFAMDPEMMAHSWTFVAVNSSAVDGANSEAVWLKLKDAQTQDWQNYYDAQADLVVSKPIPVEQLTGDLNLNFTMARMNALLKLSLKNFTLAEEEKIQSVTFACEQPLAGIITVNLADLDGVTYPIPYTLYDEESKSITFDLQAGGDLYISTLPATLKAGESYTVTVKTNQATYHKVATLPADLMLTAGDITSVAVNMGDAKKQATATEIANLNESFEYAIGYTEGDKTYLLPTTPTDLNPAVCQVGTGDLATVSVDAKGAIQGDVPALYRWNIKKTADGYYQFYYAPNYYLISCAKAQGLAVSNNGKGNYSITYYNTFSVTETTGGYVLKNSVENRYVQADAANNRWSQPTAAPAGAINFYQIQSASLQQSLYPVITNAADVMDGTYVLLFKDASGNYFTMKNEVTLSAPAAVAISEIGLTMVDGCVTEANVPADYQWIFETNEEGNLNIKQATDKTRFLREKNNGGGFAIVTNDEYDAAKEAGTITGVYEASWTFMNYAGKGLQAFAGANERHPGVSGTTWAGFKITGLSGSLVLVKLSHSTEQL